MSAPAIGYDENAEEEEGRGGDEDDDDDDVEEGNSTALARFKCLP